MGIEQIICGDCIEKLKELPDNYVDSVVTDPPYELGFMGKSWDNTGIAYNKDMWVETLRVLKPGGYLLSFGGARTYHRMACAIEDAGFEIRDMVEWIYGSGFPKSLNIGKAIDKIRGNDREEKEYVAPDGKKRTYGKKAMMGGLAGKAIESGTNIITKGTSEFEGWGTALKPAHEPICLSRKPLSEKTVAENVLKWGTGGINIDGCRVATNWKEERPESWFNSGKSKSGNPTFDGNLKSLTDSTVGERLNDAGRFPANLIHDGRDEVVGLFPNTKSGKDITKEERIVTNNWLGKSRYAKEMNYGDSGSAARFFYCAKASKAERNMGCDGLEEKEGIRTNAPRENEDVKTPTRSNNHPTVKPISLMSYLIKLVTPLGGIVLDPFAGSGSTLVAAKQLGFQFIGIEKEVEYIKIIEARVAAAQIPNKLL